MELVLWSLYPEPLNTHHWTLEREDLVMPYSPSIEVQIPSFLLCSCVALGKLLNFSGLGILRL